MKLLFEKIVPVMRKMGVNIVERDQATDGNMAHGHCILDN